MDGVVNQTFLTIQASYVASVVALHVASAAIISSPITALGAAILGGTAAITTCTLELLSRVVISKLFESGKITQEQAISAMNTAGIASIILGIAAGVSLTLVLGFAVTIGSYLLLALASCGIILACVLLLAFIAAFIDHLRTDQQEANAFLHDLKACVVKLQEDVRLPFETAPSPTPSASDV